MYQSKFLGQFVYVYNDCYSGIKNSSGERGERENTELYVQTIGEKVNEFYWQWKRKKTLMNENVSPRVSHQQIHGEIMVLVQKIKFIPGIIRFKRAN